MMALSRCSTWLSCLVVVSAVLSSCEAFCPSPPSRSMSHHSTNILEQQRSVSICQARRRRDDGDFYVEDDGEDYDEYYDDDEEDYYDDDRYNQRRDNLGEAEAGRQDRGMEIPSSFGRRKGWRLPESVSKSLLAGVFILGIGLGVTVDSAINTNPRDLASRDAIDQAAPAATLCAKYGASAMAFDQRVFVSFNPFNVYVAQADVKPACVLRDSNVVPILRDQTHLISDDEVRSCKRNMNTWAFVGELKEQPQLSCVYKSADAQNEFLSDPRIGIGEDYLDDDREMARRGGSTAKIIKGGLTQGQIEQVKAKAAANIGD